MVDIRACIYTDIGTTKSVNQDSSMVKVAMTVAQKKLAIAVLCDGMGGLSSGEVASSAVIRRMEKWFYEELPDLLNEKNQTMQLNKNEEKRDYIWELIRSNWYSIVQEMNEQIAEYGKKRNIILGTTVVAVMILDNEFLTMNVGDSRIYVNDGNRLDKITHDHSLVQQLIDRGQITEMEARNHPDKSVLLQCVGASAKVVPDFIKGQIGTDTVMVICSDGFWRTLEPKELFDSTRPVMLTSDEILESNLKRMTETVKMRGERDNISVIGLCCRP